MNKELNMVVAGLTGQGIVLAVRVLATALLAEGNKVLSTDFPPSTHRVSATYSHIRCGENIHYEAVPEGEADLLIGFEPVEGLRVGLRFASEKGLVIINDHAIPRPLVTRDVEKLFGSKFPTTTQILDYFNKAGVRNVKHFDASEVAVKEAGSLLSLNMVMVGAAAATGLVPAQVKTLENAVAQFSPRGTAENNLKAFRAGMKKFQELQGK